MSSMKWSLWTSSSRSCPCLCLSDVSDIWNYWEVVFLQSSIRILQRLAAVVTSTTDAVHAVAAPEGYSAVVGQHVAEES